MRSCWPGSCRKETENARDKVSNKYERVQIISLNWLLDTLHRTHTTTHTQCRNYTLRTLSIVAQYNVAPKIWAMLILNRVYRNLSTNFHISSSCNSWDIGGHTDTKQKNCRLLLHNSVISLEHVFWKYYKTILISL